MIDRDASAFRRLGPRFDGRPSRASASTATPCCRPASSDAYAFAAVSSGDNSNILAARVARETFGVENVVARIYDPRRAEVYQRLGIPTVATVRWTADQMLRRLLPEGPRRAARDPSGKVVLAEVPLRRAWVGGMVDRREDAAGARVAYLTRFGDGTLPGPTVVQDGDLVHLIVPRTTCRVERLCDHRHRPPRRAGQEKSPHAGRHRGGRKRRPLHRP